DHRLLQVSLIAGLQPAADGALGEIVLAQQSGLGAAFDAGVPSAQELDFVGHGERAVALLGSSYGDGHEVGHLCRSDPRVGCQDVSRPSLQPMNCCSECRMM